MLHPATKIRTEEGVKALFYALNGMKIDTPEGMRFITNFGEYPARRVFRFIFSNGIEIYTTPMTKFYTEDNHFLYAKDLKEGDSVQGKDKMIELLEIWDVLAENMKYITIKTDAMYRNYYIYDSILVG